MTIVAITNPSDEGAESHIVEELAGLVVPRRILEEFGDRLEDGAQVAMIGGANGVGRVWQYIATRDGETVALRSNNGLAGRAEGERFIDFVENADDAHKYLIEVVGLPPEPELETFTVFGENDDGERFVAVVSATEDTVNDVGVQAGLVDDGFEHYVRIDLILKGDHSDLESVTI